MFLLQTLALASPPEVPKAADAFVDSIGADSHFNYTGSPYVQEWPKVSAALLRSGIRHLRDGGDLRKPDYFAKLRYLGEHGIKHSEGFYVNATPEQIRAVLELGAPYVEMVESANEYDGAMKTDPLWAQKVVSEQRMLYATVRGDPAFAGITVLGPSLAHQSEYATLGALDDSEDGGNLHNATCNRNPGTGMAFGIEKMEALARASTLTKPIWTTEIGYNDDPVRPCAIPDRIVARYDPRTIAERFLAGEPRIYFYQLVDMPSDKIFGGMGLIDASGDPKPQFRAIASLIAQLGDPGPSFALQPLALSIESTASDLHHLLLQKRSGAYELLLWREAPSWKPNEPSEIGGSEVAVDPVTATVTTPGARAVKYSSYDSSWKFANAPLAREAPGRVRLTVRDSISILELRS